MSKTQTVNFDGVVVKVFGSPCQLKPRAPHTTYSNCGTPNIIRADLSIAADGTKIAKPGTIIDLDAMIQAAKASTDIASIVARAKMGDESVLNVKSGFTGDSVNLPKDLYDYKAMNDLYDKVSASYNTLPEGVQAAFGSSEAYLNAILNNQADAIISKYNESQKADSEGENK